MQEADKGKAVDAAAMGGEECDWYDYSRFYDEYDDDEEVRPPDTQGSLSNITESCMGCSPVGHRHARHASLRLPCTCGPVI